MPKLAPCAHLCIAFVVAPQSQKQIVDLVSGVVFLCLKCKSVVKIGKAQGKAGFLYNNLVLYFLKMQQADLFVSEEL